MIAWPVRCGEPKNFPALEADLSLTESKDRLLQAMTEVHPT